MTPELDWPMGVLLIFNVLLFVSVARYGSNWALQAVDFAQILAIDRSQGLLVQ